jgi:hypothetical protein
MSDTPVRRQRISIGRASPNTRATLLTHGCLRGRLASGTMTSTWEFERAGEVVRVEPQGPLVVSVGAATSGISLLPEIGGSLCDPAGCLALLTDGHVARATSRRSLRKIVAAT